MPTETGVVGDRVWIVCDLAEIRQGSLEKSLGVSIVGEKSGRDWMSAMVGPKRWWGRGG